MKTTADDIFSLTVDSFLDTFEVGVISAISNGEITVSAASHVGIILIDDGTSWYLFEFTASANNITLTATDDTITHFATFTDEVDRSCRYSISNVMRLGLVALSYLKF